MRRLAVSALMILFFISSAAFLAEAGTARFPVQVKWDTLARSLASTDILIVNLKTVPIAITFAFYNEDGTHLGCSVMPSTLTVPANGTRFISPSGCFAIAIGAALDFEGIGQINAPSNSVSVFWRIYDDRVSPPELIDHGKEVPTGATLKILP